MSKPIISVEQLGKCYRLGLQRDRYPTFRNALVGALKAPWQRLRELGEQGSAEPDTFWALKDINLDVQRGEVVGIIGRNGAGKSTLLKVLSRITEPTEGRAVLRGRVASLLEVGTGFHPELSGRENIYLNGSILGMRKTEIDRKFDEIVAFAEIEQFLDTPVKRYSSGMYVRLAFAVAAHLEPEILIVDEVLAVGDAQFQRKCMGKMKDVAAGDGRTVLFVSHNMPAVRTLCRSCCLLERGRVAMRGGTEECVSRYVSQSLETGLVKTVAFQRPGTGTAWMTRATLLCNGAPATVLPMGGRLGLEVHFRSLEPMQHPRLGLVVSNADGDRLLNANNRFQPSPEFATAVTEGVIRCDLGMVPLAATSYFVSLWFGDLVHDSHTMENALSFEVLEQDIWGQGKVPPPRAALMWWPVQFTFEAAGGVVAHGPAAARLHVIGGGGGQ